MDFGVCRSTKERRMAVQLGSGQWTFEVHENWAKVPEEITLGDCAAVGVDRQNRVYAFNRGEHPVAVLDRKSTRLNSSHPSISYAVFCLKKKKNKIVPTLFGTKASS